jgi:predicted metal-dependent HD superfamily phosphohydrolase
MYVDNEGERDLEFASIVERYSCAGRVYHTLSHVKALITLDEELKAGEASDALMFAIWYHDIAYDTRRADNEEKSAELAGNALGRLGVPIGTINDVEKMILATKHHDAANLRSDGELFLDLDISILGAPPRLYKEYSSAIREEYEWVPWPIYRDGRSKILSGFVQRPSIFFTNRFNAKYENQARTNIEGELNEMSRAVSGTDAEQRV